MLNVYYIPVVVPGALPRLGRGRRLPHGSLLRHLHPSLCLIPALPHRWGHPHPGEGWGLRAAGETGGGG